MKLLFLSFLLLVSARAELPDLTTAEPFTVLPTGSMKPTFDEHYMLFAKPLPFNDIRVGDVVIVKLPAPVTLEGLGTYDIVCHRVWRKSSGGRVLLTKGDANPMIDEWFVTEAMYIGTVVAIVRVD